MRCTLLIIVLNQKTLAILTTLNQYLQKIEKGDTVWSTIQKIMLDDKYNRPHYYLTKENFQQNRCATYVLYTQTTDRTEMY